MALQLKRRGITRVRPLEGGYDGWKRLGYPLVAWTGDRPGADASISAPA